MRRRTYLDSITGCSAKAVVVVHFARQSKKTYIDDDITVVSSAYLWNCALKFGDLAANRRCVDYEQDQI